MSPRRKTDTKSATPPSADADVDQPEDDAEDDTVEEAEPEVDIEVDPLAAVVDEEEVVVIGEDDDDDDEDEDDEEDIADDVVSVAVPPRPAVKPSPGRPPSAKEEPEPPFWIGERVMLVKNTRPRTGSPIGNHAVGATGRVETVLSQTAIVRFDRAPDTKEVVAFECLQSLDEVAQAARAEREVEKAAEAAAREKDAAKDGAAKKK
jgi:predicted NBD/HSP70 family sugar kinase